MENASKALIIAGAVLIAVALISIFMYVFSAIGNLNSQQQAQLQSNYIIAANRFFVESAYDVNPSVGGIQIYGYDVYNIIKKAQDINGNPDSPNFIQINSSVSVSSLVSNGELTANNIANLKKQYTYSYGFDSEGYINRVTFN